MTARILNSDWIGWLPGGVLPPGLQLNDRVRITLRNHVTSTGLARAFSWAEIGDLTIVSHERLADVP